MHQCPALESPKSDTRYSLNKHRTEVRTASCNLPTTFLLMQPSMWLGCFAIRALLIHVRLAPTRSRRCFSSGLLCYQSVSTPYVLMYGIISSQMQDLVPTSVEHQKVPVSPFISPDYLDPLAQQSCTPMHSHHHPHTHPYFIICKCSKRLNRDWYQYNNIIFAVLIFVSLASCLLIN